MLFVSMSEFRFPDSVTGSYGEFIKKNCMFFFFITRKRGSILQKSKKSSLFGALRKYLQHIQLETDFLHCTKLLTIWWPRLGPIRTFASPSGCFSLKLCGKKKRTRSQTRWTRIRFLMNWYGSIMICCVMFVVAPVWCSAWHSHVTPPAQWVFLLNLKCSF